MSETARMKMRMTVLAVLMAVTPQIRATIHRALRPDDFEVVWAADAAEAVEASAKRRPDLVLLDLKPPLQGGWVEFDSLRAANPSALMVVLAEHGAAHDRDMTDAKMTVVEKPFDAPALEDALNAMLFSTGSRTTCLTKGGDAGGASMEAGKFRESLLARHDAPLALGPSYRHWGINE